MKIKVFALISALCIFIASLAFTACNGGGEAPPPPITDGTVLSGSELSGSNVRWVGRTEYDEEKQCVYCYYTATGFTVRFTGTRLDVTFGATNTSSDIHRPYFIASTDGETAPDGYAFCLTQPLQTVTVANNLAYGEHTVTVLKRSEPENSLTHIEEITTDGDFLPAEEFTGLKFQILGGSGISGHGCLGESGEEWTTANSSSLHGFGYLAARSFGAETQFVANSGMGLEWGYRGVANLTQAYQATGLVAEYSADGSTLSVAARGQWEHGSWVPDVVIVNIGGNDWNSHISTYKKGTVARNAAETVFRQRVSSFLTQIHTLYPQARVVWTCNGTTSGNGALAAAVIEKLSFKDLIAIVTIDNTKDGADNHASAATQLKNARTVADAITRNFGLAQTS